MLWPILAMSALGAYQGQRKQDRIASQNRAEAETTRYSPWTGMKGQLHDTGGGWFDGALQGGLTGAALSQQFGGAEKATTGALPEQLNGQSMYEAGLENANAFNAGDYGKLKGYQTSAIARNPWAV